MEEIQKIFSAPAGLSRVNPAGLVLMALAVLTVAFAGKIAAKLKIGDLHRKTSVIKLGGLLLCAAGALLAIIG